MGHPRCLLIDLIDEEDQFSDRPYTQNFFPGVESLHRLYQESEFATRNARSSRVEGVYEMWQLILFPQEVLPGFITTDTVSIAGGAFWLYAYRPDRVCRQFGIDQPPCLLDLGFCNFSEAMEAVLFKDSDAIPPFDASNFIKDDKIDESPNKGVKKLKSSQSEPIQLKPKKSPSHSPKLKKKVIDPNLPRQTSSRLRAKPQPGRIPPPPSSLSHPIEVPVGDIPSVDKPGSPNNFNNCVVQDSPLLATPHAIPQGSPTTKVISGEAVASDCASTPSGGGAGEDDRGTHHGDQSPLSVAADRSVGGPKESPSKEGSSARLIVV
ncbi:putative gamma-aminobutyric acid receptor subunit alpha-4-like [Sesbania bispinosa]|nr:putative gamma-aminobutyric acid receptor subunit alpha-4-like [Sesbania bispinosa]